MEGSMIYPNPTLKQVIFQIRFPNLFFIESKIADIQLAIFEKFPESEVLIQQTIPFGVSAQSSDAQSPVPIAKIWQFSNPSGYSLKISTDSLSIDSTTHKAYYQSNGITSFREIIEYCLDGFGQAVKLPFISRVGLRYIDEVPLFDKNNETFNACFNSSLNTNKFSIEEVDEMSVRLHKHINSEYRFIYQEQIKQNSKSSSVMLDFDAYKERVLFADVLSITDQLHKIVHDEFFNTIREPIVKFMSVEK